MVKNELLQLKTGAKKLTRRILYGGRDKCADLEGSRTSGTMVWHTGLWHVWGVGWHLHGLVGGDTHTSSPAALPSPLAQRARLIALTEELECEQGAEHDVLSARRGRR